jgi:hypothetical protein
VTVTVPSSGQALVTITSLIVPPAAEEDEEGAGYMAFSSTGACPGDASDAQSLHLTVGPPNTISSFQASATYLVTGLTAGLHTFQACYRSAIGLALFENRSIVVMPLS